MLSDDAKVEKLARLHKADFSLDSAAFAALYGSEGTNRREYRSVSFVGVSLTAENHRAATEINHGDALDTAVGRLDDTGVPYQPKLLESLALLKVVDAKLVFNKQARV